MGGTSMAKRKPKATELAPAEVIEQRIFLIRGKSVMLDSHLAELYGVRTAALNQAVQRNLDRFPEDFAFQLEHKEFKSLMSQIVTSKTGRGGRRKLPWAFSEHGILMLSSVLRSERAVQVNIRIMRAFVRLRQLLETDDELRQRLYAVERQQETQEITIRVIYDAIEEIRALLLEPPPLPPPKPKIGFRPDKRKQ